MLARKVQDRCRRNEEGWLAYHLCMVKSIAGLDPDECDHDQELRCWGDRHDNVQEEDW